MEVARGGGRHRSDMATLFKVRVDELNTRGLEETHGLVGSMWENTRDDLAVAEDALRIFEME